MMQNEGREHDSNELRCGVECRLCLLFPSRSPVKKSVRHVVKAGQVTVDSLPLFL